MRRPPKAQLTVDIEKFVIDDPMYTHEKDCTNIEVRFLKSILAFYPEKVNILMVADLAHRESKKRMANTLFTEHDWICAKRDFRRNLPTA